MRSAGSGRDAGRTGSSSPGNIELTEVNIAFKTAGRLIERTVDEGDAVKKGQVIARLDRDQLLAQRERETAGLASSEAQLAQAQTALEWQRATLAADMEQRRADLAAAEARLAELRNGARPQERQDAQGGGGCRAVGGGRGRRRTGSARRRCTRTTTSRPRSSTSTARGSRVAAGGAEAGEGAGGAGAGGSARGADRARRRRRWSGRAPRVKMAEANALEMKRREQETDHAARGDRRGRRRSLALIDTQLADTVAVSPVDGVVLVKAADVGEVLAPGTTVVTVGDIDHPWLRGYVNETDLGKVKIGSKVRVTTDSYRARCTTGA